MEKLPDGCFSSWPYQPCCQINRCTVYSLSPLLLLPPPSKDQGNPPRSPLLSSRGSRLSYGRVWGELGKIVTGSYSRQNVITCLCHTLASILQAKERFKNRGPKNKGIADRTSDIGQDGLSQQTQDKGMFNTPMRWGQVVGPAGLVLVDTGGRTGQ